MEEQDENNRSMVKEIIQIRASRIAHLKTYHIIMLLMIFEIKTF